MKMESPGGIIAVESSVKLETILEARFSHHPTFFTLHVSCKSTLVYPPSETQQSCHISPVTQRGKRRILGQKVGQLTWQKKLMRACESP